MASDDFSNLGTAASCVFSVGSPTENSYPITVSACSEGTLEIRLRIDAVTDAAGNGNAQADGPVITIDRTGPSVILSTTATEPTRVSPLPFKATFLEAVTGFDSGDIGLTNASLSNFSGVGTTYTFDLTPTGEGAVIAGIAANVAEDAAGNANTAATPLSRTYDNLAPTVTLHLQPSSDTGSSNSDNLTNAASPVFNAAFNETVSGLASDDFSNLGTAASCVFSVGSPTENSYPITVSACSEGTLEIRLRAARSRMRPEMAMPRHRLVAGRYHRSDRSGL